MPPNVHHRTQVGDRYEYPAIFVLIPSDSSTVIVCDYCSCRRTSTLSVMGSIGLGEASCPPRKHVRGSAGDNPSR